MNACAKQVVCATLAFLLVGLSGCVEDNAGYDGWKVDEDASTDAESDAGQDTSSDTGADTRSDTSTSCEEIDTESACGPREECSWGAISCDAYGNPTMGCYTGSLAGAIDCRSCFDLTTQSLCESRGECAWRQNICDGEVTDEGCFPEDALPERNCPEIRPEECPQSEQCPSSVCQELHPGCGPTPEGGVELSESLCAPSTTCESSADCPGDLACAEVNVNPCHNSPCTACGSLEKRCVPPDMLPDTKNACEGLAPDECHSVDGCAAIYPAQCPNIEVPEGVVTYDEFKCLPHVAQHGDSLCEPGLSDCPDGYACGQVWAGCPPDWDCFVCASAAEVCLPQDAP